MALGHHKLNQMVIPIAAALPAVASLFKQSNTWEWGVTYSSSQLLIISDVK